MANLTGTIVNYGEAPYQNKPENNKSFFVEIDNLDGKRETRWGLDFNELIKANNVQIGDQVNFIDLGKDEATKRHKWDFEFYEPLSNDLNSIEFDDGRDVEQPAPAPKQNQEIIDEPLPKLKDFGEKIPSSIELNYVAVTKNRLLAEEKINYYDKADTTSVAFEDRKGSLHTSRADDKTIHAMLDLASSKGWSSVKLKGTEEFKQKAWLEASLRGIETKGYKPNERDLAELQAKQAERTVNNIEALEVKPLQREEIETLKPTQNVQQVDVGVSQDTQGIEQEQQQPIVMDIQKYHELDIELQNSAYLDKIGADFNGAKIDRVALSFDETREQAKNFKGQEIKNFHSGITAIISGNNLEKMLSKQAHEKSIDLKTHLLAVANADKLFENSVFAWNTEHKNQDTNIPAVHKAIAPLKIDEEVYLAKLTIKELTNNQGNRVYSVEAIELDNEKNPIPEMMDADTKKYGLTSHRLNGALIDIIVENAQNFNRNHEKNAEKKNEILDKEQHAQNMQIENQNTLKMMEFAFTNVANKDVFIQAYKDNVEQLHANYSVEEMSGYRYFDAVTKVMNTEAYSALTEQERSSVSERFNILNHDNFQTRYELYTDSQIENTYNLIKDIHDRNINKLLDFATQDLPNREDILTDYAKDIQKMHDNTADRNILTKDDYNRVLNDLLQDLPETDRHTIQQRIDDFNQEYQYKLPENEAIPHEYLKQMSIKLGLIDENQQVKIESYEKIPVSAETMHIKEMDEHNQAVSKLLDKDDPNYETIMTEYERGVNELHQSKDIQDIQAQDYDDIANKVLGLNTEVGQEKFTFTELSSADFEFNNHDEFLRHAVAIRDNETAENYIIGTYDTTYMDKTSVGVIAEYYANDKDFSDRAVVYLDENQEQVFNKLGLNSALEDKNMAQDMKDVIEHINGSEMNTERLEQILSQENLKKYIGQAEPVLDHQQSLAIETAKEIGFDSQQQAMMTNVLLELNQDKDYQSSNYVDKSNMIMTEVSGLIDKSMSSEQYIDFAEKFESKTEEIVLEQNISVSDTQQKEWQNKNMIKDNIISQIQQSYLAGEFKSRDDVVNKLSEMGYTVVRQREDGLSIENPNNVEKTIALTGDLVRANYHEAIANIHELKEQLKPENLTQNYPNLNENQLAMIKTAFAELDKPDYKTDPSGKPVPEKFEAILNEFSRNVNELAQGKIAELPMPTVTEIPKVEVKTPEHSSQERSR